MIAPLEVNFYDKVEIRMGSPYNTCSIELNGATAIDLPKVEWQDKYAWAPDFSKLILVKWAFTNNKPGFIFYIIELISGTKKESPRFEGLLNYLSTNKEKIYFNKFLYDKEKSSSGVLCCNIDDEYIY